MLAKCFHIKLLILTDISDCQGTDPSDTYVRKMGSFEAFGLFDPNSEEDDQDDDMFLSASEILEKRKSSKKGGQLPRSNTDIHLKKTSTVNHAVPRSNSSLDLKKTIKEHKGLIVKGVGRSRTFSAPIDEDYNYLPPEPQMGNIEYKLKLVNPSATRLEHLVTQVGSTTI